MTQSMSFDAPTWAARPEAAAANEVKRGEPSLLAQPTIHSVREQNISGRGTSEEEAPAKDRGDKKLGKNMVWNVLHMFRDTDGDAPEEVKKQKELLMATGGIIVLVITVAAVIVLALVLGK